MDECPGDDTRLKFNFLLKQPGSAGRHINDDDKRTDKYADDPHQLEADVQADQRRQGADADRIRAARDDAFRDHWGSQPTTDEGWASAMGQPTVRFDLGMLALDGDEVAGFVLTDVYPDDFESQGYRGGYIPLVVVRRAWRRRGVAPALLAAVFRAHRAEGFEKVALDVDSENPSGALGLYTGMGFVPESRSVAFVEEF